MDAPNPQKKMMRGCPLVAITLTVSLCIMTGDLNAQADSGQGPEMLLERARHMVLVEGDLDQAIALCQQILESGKGNRTIQAKALLQLGRCYEKLGRDDARQAYNQLVRDYADLAELVNRARSRLEALDSAVRGTAAGGPSYRLILDDQTAGIPVELFEFSPDGEQLVFRSEGSLYLADPSGTVKRPILQGLNSWKHPDLLRWSPDGQWIAFAVTKGGSVENGDDIESALFVLNTGAGLTRQVGSTVRERFACLSWTPSGHLSFFLRDGLHTRALSGEEVGFIDRDRFPGKPARWETCEYSPDGRWLTYLAAKKESGGKQNPDLWILSSTGGQAKQVTHLPGPVGYPAWAPDSRSLYFNYLGNILKLSIDPETGRSQGGSRQVTYFRDTFIGKPRVLGDGSRIAFDMRKQITSIQVADSRSPQNARTLVRSAGYAPLLSPDGQTVYFVLDSPGESGIYSIVVQGGAPKRLSGSLPAEKSHSWLPRFDLSPDGETLAYVAKYGDGQGLFTLPAKGGEPQLLETIANRELWVVPRWSPSGSDLAYAFGQAMYLIDLDGGNSRRIAHWEPGLESWTVRWSPDGNHLAVLGQGTEDRSQQVENAVFVVPSSGGEFRPLTPAIEYKEGLEWHPDGTRLTYYVARYTSETRVAYLDGRPPGKVLDVPDVWDYVGVWAPIDRRYFVIGAVGDQWGLYTFNEATGESQLVSEGLSHRSVPVWSRDGTTMAWYGTRITGNQIWIMEDFQTKGVAGR